MTEQEVIKTLEAKNHLWTFLVIVGLGLLLWVLFLI